MSAHLNLDRLESLGLLQNQSNAKSKAGSTDSVDGALGQKEFLKLMTTQLNNQDPFKPMKNGEFLGQMAMFGTVSGIGDLKKSFEELASSMQSDQGFQASSLVGRSVAVPSTQGILPENGNLEGAVKLPSSTSQLAIDIINPSGQSVKRLSLGPQSSGMVQFNWDGTTAAGTPAAPGRYAIQATAAIGNKPTSLETYSVSPVKSVILNEDGKGPRLNLGELGSVSFSDIRQIK